MPGRSLAVLGHTLVVPVVGIGHVEDCEFGSPRERIHGCGGHLVLAAVDGLARADLGPDEGHVRDAAGLANQSGGLAEVAGRLRGQRRLHNDRFVCNRKTMKRDFPGSFFGRAKNRFFFQGPPELFFTLF